MEKQKNQYFNSKKYEVLENKSMILVFRKTFWFGYLKDWKGFSKEFYTWKEDGDMNIITEENAPDLNSRSSNEDSLNKDYA